MNHLEICRFPYRHIATVLPPYSHRITTLLPPYLINHRIWVPRLQCLQCTSRSSEIWDHEGSDSMSWIRSAQRMGYSWLHAPVTMASYGRYVWWWTKVVLRWLYGWTNHRYQVGIRLFNMVISYGWVITTWLVFSEGYLGANNHRFIWLELYIYIIYIICMRLYGNNLYG